MGGNARTINKITNKVVYAFPIDLNQIDRVSFTSEIKSTLEMINDLYEEKYGEFLWVINVLIESGEIYNGSSKYLFDKSISNEEFLKYKPIVGDIDVTIPEYKSKKLFDLLSELENKVITDKVKYIGQNKEYHMGQINSIFELTHNNLKFYPQIDFEPVEFLEMVPSKFSKFAHSASWIDIQNGLKGVAHKYLLINLVRAISEMNSNDIILTKNSKLPPSEKIRIKKMNEKPRFLAFSIDKGLREKYILVKSLDNLNYYKELETNESDYFRNLDFIFTKIFKRKKYDEKFESYIGLLDLMKKYICKTKVKLTFEYLLNHIWGKDAQGLVRNNPDEDYKIKNKMVEFYINKFPFIGDYNLETLISDYYTNYKMVEEGE